MAEDIVNRVSQSALITFDLEELYPEGVRTSFDIKDWLYEGLILKEKDFRAKAQAFDWTQFQNHFVALHCSTDAIIPGWAYMLLASKLRPYTKKVVVGTQEQLETAIYQELLLHFDFSSFENKPVIIKGCSNKPVPQNAYIFAIEKVQNVAKSVMYGEACSAVPLFKRKQ
ncbi:MAG: DUF2480 family protein [Bacteroidota bacterium]